MPNTRQTTGAKNPPNIQWSLVVYFEHLRSGKKLESESVVPSHWVSSNKTILYWPDTLNVQSRKHDVPTCDWMQLDIVKIKYTGSEEECKDLVNDGYTTACDSGKENDRLSESSPDHVHFDNNSIVLPDVPSSLKTNSIFSGKAMAYQSNQNSFNVAKSKSMNSKVASSNPTHSINVVPLFASPSSRNSQMEHESAPESPPSIFSNRAMAPRSNQSMSDVAGSNNSTPSETTTSSNRPSSFKERTRLAAHLMNDVSSYLMSDVSSVSPTPKKSKFPMEQGRFQKKVLTLLCQIVDLLENGCVKQPAPSTHEELHQFDTMEEFEQYENSADDNKTLSMINSLKYIGGKDVQEAIKNALLRVMTYNLMSKFNMKGTIKSHCAPKKKFLDTKIYNAVKKAIIDTKGCTETEVYGAVEKTLKFAPDKVGASGRRNGKQKMPKTKTSDARIGLGQQEVPTSRQPKRLRLIDDSSDSSD
ncbi:uncharacterized protein [Clytia hemisphaerica]|uniref:uncharacterized protein n=1 Tax=Clytia hemisphaerica TaxID=252671 RepID=UPI0034D3CEEA